MGTSSSIHVKLTIYMPIIIDAVMIICEIMGNAMLSIWWQCTDMFYIHLFTLVIWFPVIDTIVKEEIYSLIGYFRSLYDLN